MLGAADGEGDGAEAGPAPGVVDVDEEEDGLGMAAIEGVPDAEGEVDDLWAPDTGVTEFNSTVT